MKVFGERLRTLRLANGMTQQTLAEMLCADRTTILGWELHGKEPDFQFVIDIANIFDVSIDYLLDHYEKKGSAHRENELLRVFHSLTEEQQHICIEQCKVFMQSNYNKK